MEGVKKDHTFVDIIDGNPHITVPKSGCNKLRKSDENSPDLATNLTFLLRSKP